MVTSYAVWSGSAMSSMVTTAPVKDLARLSCSPADTMTVGEQSATTCSSSRAAYRGLIPLHDDHGPGCIAAPHLDVEMRIDGVDGRAHRFRRLRSAERDPRAVVVRRAVDDAEHAVVEVRVDISERVEHRMEHEQPKR